MNLNAIVGSAIAVVNPLAGAQYRRSTGATTADSGKRAPQYDDPDTVSVQVQALTYKDLTQLQGLNLNGEKRAVYVSGNWKGVSRADQRGGDLLTLDDGSVWLVCQVLENFFSTAGWAKLAIVLQNGK